MSSWFDRLTCSLCPSPVLFPCQPQTEHEVQFDAQLVGDAAESYGSLHRHLPMCDWEYTSGGSGRWGGGGIHVQHRQPIQIKLLASAQSPPPSFTHTTHESSPHAYKLLLLPAQTHPTSSSSLWMMQPSAITKTWRKKSQYFRHEISTNRSVSAPFLYLGAGWRRKGGGGSSASASQW